MIFLRVVYSKSIARILLLRSSLYQKGTSKLGPRPIIPLYYNGKQTLKKDIRNSE